MVVSRAFHGGLRSEEFVTRFAGAPLRRPQPGLPDVDEHHRAWHQREVLPNTIASPERSSRPARAWEHVARSRIRQV